jgi:hypothetical protein
MPKFRIKADVQVKVWQKCVFDVEADSIDKAKAIIDALPSSTCVNYETLTETEEVIKVDFDENFSFEEVENF